MAQFVHLSLPAESAVPAAPEAPGERSVAPTVVAHEAATPPLAGLLGSVRADLLARQRAEQEEARAALIARTAWD
jgi:hypothetical protein